MIVVQSRASQSNQSEEHINHRRSTALRRPFFMDDVAQSSGHASLEEQIAAADADFQAMKEQWDQSARCRNSRRRT
jgi:hypothetical protein